MVHKSGLHTAALWLLFTLTLAAVAGITVFFPLAANIPINILLPIFILFVCRPQPFAVIKALTLVAGRILLALTVMGCFPNSLDLILLLWLWLLRINIFEAVIKDLLHRHFLNALSGLVLLIATMHIYVVWRGFYYLMLPNEVIIWILAYTLWNFNFIYLNFSKTISLYHLGVLIAPLIAVLITANPGLYMTMRAATLDEAVAFQVLAEKKAYFHWLESESYQTYSAIFDKKVVQVVLTGLISGLCVYFMVLV